MCNNCMLMSCRYRFYNESIKFYMGLEGYGFSDVPFTTVWHQDRMKYMVGCKKRKPDGAE